MHVWLAVGAAFQFVGVAAVVIQIAFVQAKQARMVLGDAVGASAGAVIKVTGRLAARIRNWIPGPKRVTLHATSNTIATLSATATLRATYANEQDRLIAELQRQLTELRGRVEVLEAGAAEPHDSIADRIADIRRLGGWVLAGGAFFATIGLGITTAVAWVALPAT